MTTSARTTPARRRTAAPPAPVRAPGADAAGLFVLLCAYAGPGAVAAETLDVVGDSSRAALKDLRRLPGITRIEPGAGLARDASAAAAVDTGRDLEEVAAALREVGFRPDTRVGGDLARIPEGVRPTAQRVLREASTNITKHAPARTSRALAVLVDEADIRVEGHNDAARAPRLRGRAARARPAAGR